jgi:hypothetical protein
MFNKLQIRAARKMPLPPILIHRGYKLHPLRDGNYSIGQGPAGSPLPADITIKESYWTSDQLQRGGNTIDFFTQFEGLSFFDAMRVIVQSSTTTSPATPPQSHRGNTPEQRQKLGGQ